MKFLYSTIFLLLSLSSLAQVQIGSSEFLNPGGAGKIKKTEYEALKKTTTLFTLQFKDYEEEALFEKAIRKVWTITPFKIIRPEDIGKYQNAGYSFFTFGGTMVSKQQYLGTAIHLSYDLWMPNLKKKNGNRELLSKIYLFADFAAIHATMQKRHVSNNKFSEFIGNYMYNDANLYTWNPGFLQGFLKEINDQLIAGETKKSSQEFKDISALKQLSNDTLYVPDYVKIRFNALTGSEKEVEDKDDALSEAYKYPIRFVSIQELNHLIVSGVDPIKYLVYVRSAQYKWVNIYESRKGNLLYSEMVSGSYNFKNKDLRKVAKLID